MYEWLQENLVAPTAHVLDDLRVGEEYRDIGEDRGLCIGIEGLIRYEAPAQYQPWPPESTTDGLTGDLCIKIADHTIEFVGMCWIDFGGQAFPLRAQIQLTPDHREPARFTAQIGEVDPKTGAPPRLPPGSMIIPSRNEDGNNPIPELLAGRRVHSPIAWTQVVTYPAGNADDEPVPSFLFPGEGRSDKEIAQQYVIENARLARTSDEEPDEWASFHIGNLIFSGRVEEAWTILVLAIDSVDDEAELNLLGAGYLENVVRDHGPEFIDRIEAEAARSTRFRRALLGVWAFDSPIRQRIDALIGDERDEGGGR